MDCFKRKLSIYIHIPFCVRRCLYCDFVSFSGRHEYFEQYKNALISEIEVFECPENVCAETLFFGGGTPSVFPPEYISEICGAVYKKFSPAGNMEITIEANPGTVGKSALKIYKESGINRISMGLQAWQNHVLQKLGRIHTRDDFLESFYLMRNTGFDNINVDLMFALPFQSIKEWEETVAGVAELGPEHISAYSLIIEEGTPFYDMFAKKELTPVSDDDDREMYYLAEEILKKAGYSKYEISNFSRRGYECRHNITYWKRKEYLGFGLAAHSFFDGMRFFNTDDFERYINGNFREGRDIIGERDAYAEFMFLGLRMTEGVRIADFKNIFGKDIYNIYGGILNDLALKGLIVIGEEYIYLTPKGIDVSNIVFSEFL